MACQSGPYQYWDNVDKKCVKCLGGQHYDNSLKACASCPNNYIFNEITYTCVDNTPVPEPTPLPTPDYPLPSPIPTPPIPQPNPTPSTPVCANGQAYNTITKQC